jgi:HSP20 family protein
MLISRFDPFKQLQEFERSFYDNNLNKNEGVSGFVPVVNTREGEFAYHIDVDLPGVAKEDIKVDIHKNILTISGERKTKEEVKEEDYYKVETSFGKFSRSFTLPDNADVENVEASSKDGVLEVVVPKLSEEKHKKIIEIK